MIRTHVYRLVWTSGPLCPACVPPASDSGYYASRIWCLKDVDEERDDCRPICPACGTPVVVEVLF